MTAAKLIDQTSITSIWRALGGGEIRHGRGQAWWRKGDGWSVALDDKRNVWFDHRDSIGGGVLDLIRHIRGGSRGEALHWLADWQCVSLDGARLSHEDRRRYAQARQDAPELARQAEIWWLERRAELERAKADALAAEEAACESGEDSLPAVTALAAAASEHHLLSILAQEGVVRAYLDARRRWPKHTQALVADGERWAEASEFAVAALIARWHDDRVDVERWETDGGATA